MRKEFKKSCSLFSRQSARASDARRKLARYRLSIIGPSRRGVPCAMERRRPDPSVQPTVFLTLRMVLPCQHCRDLEPIAQQGRWNGSELLQQQLCHESYRTQ